MAHTTKKPGCSSTIIEYFAHRSPRLIAASPSTVLSPPAPPTPLTSTSTPTEPSHHLPPITSITPIKPSELIVVGDRVFTDVILGNKLGALSIWTTGLWERELMPMRYVEYSVVRLLDDWSRRRVYWATISAFWARSSMRLSRLRSRSRKQVADSRVDASTAVLKNSTSTVEPLPTPTPTPIPTPQQLFVRPPAPPPPPKPAHPILVNTKRALGIIGTGIRLSYRGTRTAVVWSFNALRNYRNGSKASPTIDSKSGTQQPAVSTEPPQIRFLNATLSLLRSTTSKLIGLSKLGFRRLIGEAGEVRLRQFSTRVRQLSSRIGMMGRRVMKSWPHRSQSHA